MDSLPPNHTLRSLDYRDQVIRDLADTEARLLERIRSLEADTAVRDELVRLAVDALHHVIAERDRLHRERARLREEFRQLRNAGRAA